MMEIGIIDDDATIRNGLTTLLGCQDSFACTIVSDSVESFIEKLDTTNAPAIILLDISLPGISGLDGLRILKRLMPDSKIIMNTGNDESAYIFRSFHSGANGYLLKNNLFFEVVTAINCVAEGNAYLSPVVTRKVLSFFNNPPAESIGITDRERQIVKCLVDGLSYKLIAAQLNISLDTVRFHLKNLYKKLRVNSKTEVISKALKGEIIAA